MLTELLETRVMVKQAMKSVKEDKASTAMYKYFFSHV
jgi:DNA polymerase elongation subunit (family B)